MQRNHSQWAVRGTLVSAVIVGLGFAQLWASEPPEPKPVAEYASADALVSQVELYLAETEEELAKTKYSKLSQVRVAKYGQSLTLLFLALGQHEKDTPFKANAKALADAANALRKDAENKTKTAAHYKKLQAALKAGGDGPGELKWDLAYIDFHAVMKQVQTVSGKLKRNARKEDNLAKKREESIGHAALLAVLAQAAILDTHEVKDKKDLPKWYEYAVAMRDSAGAAGQAIEKKKNFDDVTAAVAGISKSCADCHKIFRPEQQLSGL